MFLYQLNPVSRGGLLTGQECCFPGTSGMLGVKSGSVGHSKPSGKAVWVVSQPQEGRAGLGGSPTAPAAEAVPWILKVLPALGHTLKYDRLFLGQFIFHFETQSSGYCKNTSQPL